MSHLACIFITDQIRIFAEFPDYPKQLGLLQAFGRGQIACRKDSRLHDRSLLPCKLQSVRTKHVEDKLFEQRAKIRLLVGEIPHVIDVSGMHEATRRDELIDIVAHGLCEDDARGRPHRYAL